MRNRSKINNKHFTLKTPLINITRIVSHGTMNETCKLNINASMYCPLVSAGALRDRIHDYLGKKLFYYCQFLLQPYLSTCFTA